MASCFRISVCVPLFTAAVLKALFVMPGSVVPSMYDDVFWCLPIKHITVIAIVGELAVVGLLVGCRASRRQLYAVFWLASMFSAYKAAGWLVGNSEAGCYCLGKLSGPGDSLSWLSKGLLLYIP